MPSLTIPTGPHLLLLQENLTDLRGHDPVSVEPAWPAKDPAEVIDLAADFRLLTDGAALDSISAVGDNCVVEASAVAGTVAVLRIAGGTDGALAFVALTAFFNAGEVRTRVVRLPVVAERAVASHGGPAVVAAPGEPGFVLVSATLDNNGHLILGKSDGGSLDVGLVRGPAGAGLAHAQVDAAGHLQLTLSDGSVQDAGSVLAPQPTATGSSGSTTTGSAAAPVAPAVPSFPPGAGSFLFDTLAAQAVAGFSLRRLRAGHTAPLLRVRRSTDNAMAYFGLAADSLDTAALLAFCGNGDGFVVDWFGQAAGERASQSAPDRQPRIVQNGAITALGNPTARPALSFATSAQQCLADASFSFPNASAFAASAVAQLRDPAVASQGRIVSYAPPGGLDYDGTLGCVLVNAFGSGVAGTYFAGDGPTGPVTGLPFVLLTVQDGAQDTLLIDAAAPVVMPRTGTLAPSGRLTLGADQDWGECLDGSLSEALAFTGALSSADQAALRASQQPFYGTP